VPAQQEDEKPDATCCGDETAEAHDAEADVFAERSHVLFARIDLAAESVQPGPAETQGKDGLTRAKPDELPAGRPCVASPGLESSAPDAGES
jgi:hypothetical protein